MWRTHRQGQAAGVPAGHPLRDLQAARGKALTGKGLALPSRLLAVGIGALGLAIDQASKIAAIANLTPGQPVDLLGKVLRLNLIRNPGAAFGMGSNLTLVLSCFAIAALVGCLAVGLPWIRKPSHGIALGLLMAGISGNLYDRLFREPSPLLGHVIDFFQLPYFAIFNVADICITSAAVLVVLLSFAETKPKPEVATEDA